MRHRAKIYTACGLLVCLVSALGYLALGPDPYVTVYDKNFKIIDYRLAQGARHTIYQGSPTIGRIRANLRNRFGLKFIASPQVTGMHVLPNSLILILRYKGDFPIEELDGLAAILTNDKDVFHHMDGNDGYEKGKQRFSQYYLLPKAAMSADSLRLDFFLRSEFETPIATLKVGELYKHAVKL